MDYLQVRRDYVGSLDGLEKLAVRDLTAWWDQTEGTPFLQRRELMQEPYVAIAQAYGEQAAHAAADYLFLQRSLDETLAGAAYPDVASPVEYEQAVASYRAASRLSDEDWKVFAERGRDYLGAEFSEVTFQKLSGALNRLVLQPARETIAGNIPEDARFARVPEPGACNWCLMIASRGADFSASTAGMTKATRYHDNCRCVAIEVSDAAPLPRINQDLEQAWAEATKGGGGEATVYRKWKNYLDRRSKILQQQVEFPDIPGVEVPTYTGKSERLGMLPDGKTMTVALPPLHQVPGHVLYGWSTAPPWGRKRDSARRRPPGDYRMDNQFGHRHGSKRTGTTFPAEWSDQEIVDSVREVIETGDLKVYQAPSRLRADRKGNEWEPDYDYEVIASGTINGERITATYLIVDGVAVQPYGYPKR